MSLPGYVLQSLRTEGPQLMPKVPMAPSTSLVWEGIIGGRCREGEEGMRPGRQAKARLYIKSLMGLVRALGVYPQDLGSHSRF